MSIHVHSQKGAGLLERLGAAIKLEKGFINPIDARAGVGDNPLKMKSTIQKALLYVLANVGAGLAIYFTGVGSAHLFGNTQSVFSPIWPAGGVALASALLLGSRVWPGIFLPLFIASHAGGHAWLFSLLAPAGMAFFVSMAAKLLKGARFNTKLTSTRDVLLLAGLGAALPMGLAGFWSAACLILSGMMPVVGLWGVGSIYWAMNTAGTIVVAPVILLLASGRFWPRKMRFHEVASTCVQLGCVFAAAWLAFHGKHSSKASLQALAYLPFPFLVWVALTRGLPAAALSVLFIVFTAVTFTSRGCGPFVSNSVAGTIWQIESFIAIVSTTGLLIAAGSEAQKREKILQAIAAKKTAELERLTAQVNPHFLFNCLNVIHSLILTDTQAAQTGVTSLAKLLRNTLDLAKEPLIPLSKELDIIRESLRLQKMRYEDGLEWSVSANAGSEEFPVPPMLLQPLVENSINYGVVDGFGRVELHAQIQEDDLIVHIRNTAPLECDPTRWKENIGLASVRARIEDMCPPGSGVTFSKTPEGLIEALVRIKRVISKKP